MSNGRIINLFPLKSLSKLNLLLVHYDVSSWAHQAQNLRRRNQLRNLPWAVFEIWEPSWRNLLSRLFPRTSCSSCDAQVLMFSLLPTSDDSSFQKIPSGVVGSACRCLESSRTGSLQNEALTFGFACYLHLCYQHHLLQYLMHHLQMCPSSLFHLLIIP